MEPPSPIKSLGVNPFPSRFITIEKRFRAQIEGRANESREMTVQFYVKQQAARAIQNGSYSFKVYKLTLSRVDFKSTREMVNSRN